MNSICNQIESKKILLIGDLILDRFFYGTVNRISPEAPVPVFLEKSKEASLGGAGNVAVNLVAANQKVTVISVIGDDEAGEEIRQLLLKYGIDCSYLIKDLERITSVKNRFLGDNKQQLIRHDYERIQNLSKDCLIYFRKVVEQIIKEYDVLVISDYGKGICTDAFLRMLVEISKKNNVPVLCDVKGVEANKYKGVTLIKPNLKELRDLTRRKIETEEEIIKSAFYLLEICESEYVLTTCGANGMIMVDKQKRIINIEANKCEVFDVTGAGDTVLAFIATGFANNLNMETTLHMANYAGGLQVQRSGTVAISLQEVEACFEKEDDYLKKIIDNSCINKIRKETYGKKIVFTNGCFDILHAGHVLNLKRASELGDILVVALNSDASVKNLKGENRPVNTLDDRMCVIAALEVVDYVTWFDEGTPYELINQLKPDVIVKGEDYKDKYVVGSDIVSAYGGSVVLLPYLNGHSTTDIINRINNVKIK